MSTPPTSSPLFPEDARLARPAPRGLGRMMAGGAGMVERKPLDYYPTPPEVTRALLRAEGQAMRVIADGRLVWEPCGRGGGIVRELARAGFETVASDVVPDPEHGVAQADLLALKHAWGPLVVTNPPFALASEMIVHLLDRLGVSWCALLLKASFFHAEERRGLFERHPPARIHALTWRPDFLGGGAPTMECAWFVWQRGWHFGTHYRLMPREAGQAGLW